MSSPHPTLAQIGESALIRRLTSGLPASPDVTVGIGDDCAVVHPSPHADEEWVFTSDPVIEGRHFTTDDPAEQVGAKAIGRVLSDLAAMGAAARWALVNLAAPAETPVTRLEALYRGLQSMAARFGLSIIGGDVAESSPLSIHVFATGALPRGSARLRSGVRPGDLLYVTGQLGGSRAGRHLTFTPRIREGIWLRERVNGMIDISDGLASELLHLAQASSLELHVEADRVPLHPDSDLHGALNDGEDFELLFSLPATAAPDLEAAWPQSFPVLTRIGTANEGSPQVLQNNTDGTTTPLTGGFRHFGPDL